jgi:hypothetical protein
MTPSVATAALAIAAVRNDARSLRVALPSDGQRHQIRTTAGGVR